MLKNETPASTPGEPVDSDELKLREECERICGESGKRGIHSSAPRMCPILDREWKNPKRLVPHD